MKMRHRKASHRRPAKNLRVDKKTGAKHLSHCVDPQTGMYKGRQVLTVQAEG